MSVNGTVPQEKSTTERQLEKALQKVETLKARRRAEIRERVQSERKKRTRQLIKIGAVLTKHFNINPLTDDPEEVDKFLSRNVLFAVAISPEGNRKIDIKEAWRIFIEKERRREYGNGN